jgi:hypothetical protein|mmetsp:Transcript_54291/g.86301  ORF Transcript_54291/g.86301 Transcript_54291/m.86301 type:complete len:238 (-) Transcript_54291:107-820(-)
MQQDPDELRRLQTDQMVDVRQKSASAMTCCVAILQFAGAGIFGYWYLWSSKAVAEDDFSGSNTTLTTPLPLSDSKAWSTWYLYQAYFVIGLKSLTGLMCCIAFAVSRDEHLVKEQLYLEQGRAAEAAEEHDQEAGSTQALQCVSTGAKCISGCAQCGLGVWCCIGLFMLLGVSALGTVESGINNDSRWYLIIMLSSCAFDCCLILPVAICSGSLGAISGLAGLKEEEASDEEASAEE